MKCWHKVVPTQAKRIFEEFFISLLLMKSVYFETGTEIVICKGKTVGPIKIVTNLRRKSLTLQCCTLMLIEIEWWWRKEYLLEMSIIIKSLQHFVTEVAYFIIFTLISYNQFLQAFVNNTFKRIATPTLIGCADHQHRSLYCISNGSITTSSTTSNRQRQDENMLTLSYKFNRLISDWPPKKMFTKKRSSWASSNYQIMCF